MPGNVYVPGQTYSMSVTVAQSGINLFGVGLEALVASGDNGGTLNITDPSSTQIRTAIVGGFSRRNVVHTANGGVGNGSKTFNFSWTAPAIGTGNVTFYFSGIASNANTTSTGDWVYQGTSLTVTEQPCNPPAQPTQISGTGSPCVGSTQTYSVAADPSATSYTWTLPNGWTGTSSSNSITATAGSTAGNITVVAFNACGPSSIQSFSVNPIQISAIVATTNVLCNGNVDGTATVIASGGAVPYTYDWIPNVSSGPSANALPAGNYTVTVSNAGNCPTTQSFTINEPPVLVADAGSSVPACEGSSVVLGGIPPSGGTPPYTYQWIGNTGVISSSLSPVVSATSNENFIFTVTDANGCSASDSTQLSVVSLPTPSTITAFNDTLFASQTFNYQWYYNNTLIQGATSNIYAPTANGDYYVEVTDPVTGCTNQSQPFTYLSTAISAVQLTNIAIYPNPASENIVVTNDWRSQRELNYQLISSIGTVVSSGQLQELSPSLSVSSLSNGCYSLLLECEGKRSAIRLLIQR